MSRRDLYHQAVRHALEAEGWTITHDPYVVSFGEQTLQIDLGAEMPLAAERAGEKIVVEIKSFASASLISDLYVAIGQYTVYRTLVEQQDSGRIIYLAVPEEAFGAILDTAAGRDLRATLQLRLIVYNAEKEVIRQWLP